MSDDIYQQAILDHAKAAEDGGSVETPDASVTLDNPLCGDRVRIDVKMSGARIAALAHRVRGCALCQAAADVIRVRAVGQTVDGIAATAAELRAMLKDERLPPAGAWSDLGIFLPVRRHRSRHDCVLLPFAALGAALQQARASRG